MFDWLRKRDETPLKSSPPPVPPSPRVETLNDHKPSYQKLPFNKAKRDASISQAFDYANEINEFVKKKKELIWSVLLEHLADSYTQRPEQFSQLNIKKNIHLFHSNGLTKVTIRLKKESTIDSATLDGVKPAIMACLNEWSDGAKNYDAIQTVIKNAFELDASGNVNRFRVWLLFQIDSKDPRWVDAMDRLKNSSVVKDVSRYILFYRRETIKSDFEKLILNFTAL